MVSLEPQETWAVIKVCCQLVYEMFEMIKQTCADNNLSRTQVFEWHLRLREGRLSIEDDRECDSKGSMDATSVTAVKDVVYSVRGHLCTLTIPARR